VNEFESNKSSGQGDENDATRTFSEDLLPSDPNALSSEEQLAVDSLPSGNALLVVRRGPNKGARFLLDADLLSVGRHPNADIFLDDVTVSRRHTEISRVGTVFAIKDLTSLNGTYFEGKRVEAAELFNGAEVQIGKYHFTFYSSKKEN
jgi:pSer/pThr/pTyr-binding forkhead associated (FHA) protein